MSALTAQPTDKAALEKPRAEPIGLRSAMFARHRNARGMNDVSLDALRGEPTRQPEAVVSGLERDREPKHRSGHQPDNDRQRGSREYPRISRGFRHIVCELHKFSVH